MWSLKSPPLSIEVFPSMQWGRAEWGQGEEIFLEKIYRGKDRS
jgi:hypothetical protein